MMLQVTIHNWKGKKVGDLELSDSVFGVKRNDVLLQQVTLGLMANQRTVLAHTKDRAERAGSGRKPWKQKGTGRARAGSVRTPLWRKGGVVFGPTKERNFKQKINHKMRRQAVAMAVSGKVEQGKLVVVDVFPIGEPKTKLFANGLTALTLSRKGVTVATLPSEQTIIHMSRNIARIENTSIDTLNVLDILNREYLLISQDGVKRLTERLQPSMTV